MAFTPRHQAASNCVARKLQVLAGLLTATRLGAPLVDWRLLLAAGVVGMGLSASHLGHLERA